MQENLEQFMLKHGLTGASIARSLGVSTAIVSQIKNGKTDKIKKDMLQKFDDFMANYQSQNERSTKDDVVSTGDFKMIHFTIEETFINREMGAIYGNAGTGKTTAIKAYIDKHPEVIFVETIPMMSVKELLLDILEGQGTKNAVGTQKELLKMIVQTFKRSERVLIIDEAENLTTKSLEAIRRIHDFSKVPTVLVGTHSLISNLKGRQGELLQLYSRISNKWEMQGLSPDDRTALFGDLGTVIKQYTPDIRRSMSIYRKAKRYAQIAGEELNANHIQMATQSVILD